MSSDSEPPNKDREPSNKDRRMAVRLLDKLLTRLSAVQFEPSDLKPLSIRVLPLALGNNEQPVPDDMYFSPAKLPDEYPEPEGRLPDFKWPEGWKREPLVDARCIADYFKSRVSDLVYDPNNSDYRRHPVRYLKVNRIWEVDQERGFNWRSTGYGDPSDGPRRKCIILNGVDGDERLLRGELLSMCRIMWDRLIRVRHIRDMVVPVMIFSFMGRHHGRLLIGHHDGTNLIVRKSELLDFTDPSSYDVLLPWWFSSGVGDTTAE